MEVDIQDKNVDEFWLQEVLSDLWDVVKKVRKKSGPKQQFYTLYMNGQCVEIEIRKRP